MNINEFEAKNNSDDFSSELYAWINKNNISRKDLISALQLADYEEFKGLDNITLSRWLTGKTVPPLYRQFVIAQVLNINLTELILKVDISKLKPTNKLSKVAESLVRMLDFAVTTLSYSKIPDSVSCQIEYQTYEEHIQDFGDFHSNISALDEFFEHLYRFGDTIQYPAIKLLSASKETIGHWTGMAEIEKLASDPYFSFLETTELAESCLLSVGYYKSSKHFFELIVYGLCYYLISLSKHKRYAYICVAGYPMYELVKLLLSIEDSKYFPPGKHDSKLGVYMLKVDILKALCNPLLLPMIQEKMRCLTKCSSNICTDCNLKQFFS